METIQYTSPTSGHDVALAAKLHPAGGGDLLVAYVHGLGSSQLGTKAQFFRERFNGIGIDYLGFDFQGHGRSTGDTEGLTLTRQLEDLDAVVAHYEARYARIVLLGSSLGGWTSAWFAARFPDRVHRCILIAPAFRFVDGLRRWAGDGLADWERTGRHTFVGPEGEFTVRWDIVADRAGYADEALWNAFRTPTLAVHGMRDDVVAWRDTANFAERASAAVELVLLGRGDHQLHAFTETMWRHFRGFVEGAAA